MNKTKAWAIALVSKPFIRLKKLVRACTRWAWREPMFMVLKERDFYKAECERLSNVAGRYATTLNRIAYEGGNNPVAMSRAALGHKVIQ